MRFYECKNLAAQSFLKANAGVVDGKTNPTLGSFSFSLFLDFFFFSFRGTGYTYNQMIGVVPREKEKGHNKGL